MTDRKRFERSTKHISVAALCRLLRLDDQATTLKRAGIGSYVDEVCLVDKDAAIKSKSAAKGKEAGGGATPRVPHRAQSTKKTASY